MDKDATFEVVMDMWNRGLIHQPRKFGAHPSRRPEFWLEAVLVDDDIDRNPVVKDAWQQFQTVAGLTDTNVVKDYF
jgi:hypothetical protein